MPTMIPISQAQVGDLELRFVADAVQHAWGSRYYEWIDRFEREFAGWTQSQHAIATSSATGALHIVLQALGVGVGDEVILADSNWIATAAPIVQLGAQPVFVDIEPGGFCIDADAVAKAITPHTRAIIVTHLFGAVADMDSLMEFGIPIIEDCAEAVGSTWQNRHVGNTGVAGIFSFHHSKTITGGEGGAIITNDTDFYQHCWQISNHGRGRTQPRQMWAEAVGLKYKISSLQAALLTAQLQRLPEMLHQRRSIMQRYRDALANTPGITIPADRHGTANGAWMSVAVLDSRWGYMAAAQVFKECNIEVREFFPPLSSMPMFTPARTPNAQAMSRDAICLPCYPGLLPQDQMRVINALRHAVGSQGLVDLQQ